MSIFELISVTLSIVLGLSMSHILWSVTALVRARREIELHWLPLVWAALVFLAQVQYWFAVLSVDERINQWTWGWYLQMLFLALLLFSSGALILPSEAQRRTSSLLEDFDRDGRLGLIPFAAYFLAWIPTNVAQGSDPVTSANVANFLIAVAAFGGISGKNRVARIGSAGLALVVFLWAMIFTWAQNAIAR